MEKTSLVAPRRKQVAIEPGRSLYTREPGRSEKDDCHNGRRRSSPSFDRKGSRHKSIEYNEKINHCNGMGIALYPKFES